MNECEYTINNIKQIRGNWLSLITIITRISCSPYFPPHPLQQLHRDTTAAPNINMNDRNIKKENVTADQSGIVHVVHYTNRVGKSPDRFQRERVRCQTE